MPESLVGKRIGPFEVLSLLGHGGMADVFRAYQPSMKRDVALKVISDSVTKASNFMTRFRREVELVANLEHAHIIPVFDYGITDDGATYLAMRYIKGGTLTERIAKESPLPVEQVNSILQQIAAALDYAHSKGVIHRDIKPSNVLLDEQQNAYLADFGLAQLAESEKESNLTRSGTLVGTPSYIAPEQALASKSDFRSDLYSLGCVLYEMLAGKPPFRGETIFAIMQAHVTEPPPLILKSRPDLPMAIEAIIQKSLAKSPEDRYRSAFEMAREFSLAIQGLLTTPPPLRTTAGGGVATLNSGAFKQTQSRLFAAGAVIIIVLLLGLLVVPRLTPTATPPTPTDSAASNGSPGPKTNPTPVPTVAENLRPDTGTSESVNLTATDIDVARQRMQGSFIGIAACTLETEYHASLVAAALTRAKSLGLEARVENAEKQPSKQSAIINQFIAQGARAIIICDLDLNVISPAITRAQEAGIIIAINSDRIFGKAAVSFTVPNKQMGGSVGAYAADVINKERGGKANVVVLDYPSLPQIVARADAMISALKAGAPNVVILGRYLGGVPEDGEKSIAQALKEHPELDTILSINDAGAFGAVNALKAAGKKTDEVMIFSVDAEQDARRMIATHEYFRGSFDTDPQRTANLMIQAIVKMSAGGIVPRQVLMEGNVVTRDNLSPTATTLP